MIRKRACEQIIQFSKKQLRFMKRKHLDKVLTNMAFISINVMNDYSFSAGLHHAIIRN
ncbi:hypothetical protein J14TS5_42000 [Paenibacillus lautus]|nr:hypothetical protein J14TS5_42000 [Paenibacillus lautus]